MQRVLVEEEEARLPRQAVKSTNSVSCDGSSEAGKNDARPVLRPGTNRYEDRRSKETEETVQRVVVILESPRVPWFLKSTQVRNGADHARE